MLLIGCFGELSIILRVTIYILYIIIFSTGINRPGVFCEYDTYLILNYIYIYINMYVQVLYTLYFLQTKHKTILYNRHLLTLKTLFKSVYLYVFIHQRGFIARLVRLQKGIQHKKKEASVGNILTIYGKRDQLIPYLSVRGTDHLKPGRRIIG